MKRKTNPLLIQVGISILLLMIICFYIGFTIGSAIQQETCLMELRYREYIKWANDTRHIISGPYVISYHDLEYGGRIIDNVTNYPGYFDYPDGGPK